MVGRSAQGGPQTFEELAHLATDAIFTNLVYDYLKV